MKYFAPWAAAIIGFVLLGPLGALLGVAIWAVLRSTPSSKTKK